MLAVNRSSWELDVQHKVIYHYVRVVVLVNSVAFEGNHHTQESTTVLGSGSTKSSMYRFIVS
jgi:hypothetical protein